MIDQHIIRKIYRSIDGDLSPQDQADLENFLAQNPEAEQIYRDWKNIDERFGEGKDLLPAIDLKQQILNKIDMEKYVPSENVSFSEKMQRLFFSPRFKIGFAFVLGIFLGVFVFSLFKQGMNEKQVKQQDVSGTIWDSRTYDQMVTADNLLFESPMAKATFNVKYSTKLVEAHINISSLYPVKVAINFDPDAFMTFNVQNTNVNDQTTAMSSSNYIEINNVGDNQFVVLLYNKNSLPHSLNFTIYQNELPLYRNSVTINKE